MEKKQDTSRLLVLAETTALFTARGVQKQPRIPPPPPPPPPPLPPPWYCPPASGVVNWVIKAHCVQVWGKHRLAVLLYRSRLQCRSCLSVFSRKHNYQQHYLDVHLRGIKKKRQRIRNIVFVFFFRVEFLKKKR